MTFGDLLDQVASNADDDAASYRTNARRWLNLSRSYIASKASWRSALTEDTFATVSGTRMYDLIGTGGTQYEAVHGDRIFDQTNSLPLEFVGLQQIEEQDPERTVTGPASVWADGGMSSSGVRQLFLWPTPDAAYTIQFWGYKLLADLDENSDQTAVDPYFGPITPWAATFAAGLHYFQQLDDNTDGISIAGSMRAFERLIQSRKSVNTVVTVTGFMRADLRSSGMARIRGRLDPAHYSNG